jgi:hypothetical protein
MSQNAPFDATIPVLTEVFEEHRLKDASPAAEAEAGIEARAIDHLTAPEWSALERRLSERILHQLQDRVDFVLEQRVRDSMAEALNHALSGLTDEIRVSLQRTIEQIVERTVAQELAHLQIRAK